MPPPPNPFRIDPPTGVHPVYDSLHTNYPPFQPSTQTPEELLPDIEAVWRAGGELKPEQIQGFMNAITTANLRADPTYYGDGPRQWQKPTTLSCEIWPVVYSVLRTSGSNGINVILRKLLQQMQNLAPSRCMALDGHTLSFCFWRDIHFTHIGRCASYLFSHKCDDDLSFGYDVYWWREEDSEWMMFHDVCQATSTTRVMVVARESGSRVYLPYAPKIVLDWVDTILYS